MPHLSLKDFFLLLCSFKNIAGWVQSPSGSALEKFLAEKTKLNQFSIGNKIDRLAELKYIEKEFRGPQKEILWRVKILREWNETSFEKSDRERIAPPAPEVKQAEQKINKPIVKTPANPKPKLARVLTERRFAIFIDFSNLENNLSRSTDRFRDFSWLLDPVLEKGKIIFAFVFIPDHYVSRAPIMQLTHKHHFHAVFCPRQISGAVTKDADTVDAQMQELAWALVQHSDITDVVIVSGDADFQRLATHARWQQKRVMIVSAEKAISGRFLEMAQDGSLVVQLVT